MIIYCLTTLNFTCQKLGKKFFWDNILKLCNILR